jgi:hypothetical protein
MSGSLSPSVMAGPRMRCSCDEASLTLLEEQEMIASQSCTSIGVQTPTLLLPFFDCVADVIVITDIHTCVLLQLSSPPQLLSLLMLILGTRDS